MLFSISITFFLIILIFFLKDMFPLGRIYGTSMYPTYKPNQVILLKTKFKLLIGRCYAYEVVDSQTNEVKLVIKRLKEIVDYEGKKYLYFLGDNSVDSLDSRHYGYVESDRVIAQVLIHRKEK